MKALFIICCFVYCQQFIFSQQEGIPIQYSLAINYDGDINSPKGDKYGNYEPTKYRYYKEVYIDSNGKRIDFTFNATILALMEAACKGIVKNSIG